ncbi:MAG: hypothetical protein MZV63_63915 [Marinilabiliales bacterium]|nr:hypothetical protein [Marinilabiliales bacterium]
MKELNLNQMEQVKWWYAMCISAGLLWRLQLVGGAAVTGRCESTCKSITSAARLQLAAIWRVRSDRRKNADKRKRNTKEKKAPKKKKKKKKSATQKQEKKKKEKKKKRAREKKKQKGKKKNTHSISIC